MIAMVVQVLGRLPLLVDEQNALASVVHIANPATPAVI